MMEWTVAGQGRTVEDKEEKSGSSSAVSSLCVARTDHSAFLC